MPVAQRSERPTVESGIIGPMDRYVFYAKESLDAKTIRAARAMARAAGVTVVQTGLLAT